MSNSAHVSSLFASLKPLGEQWGHRRPTRGADASPGAPNERTHNPQQQDLGAYSFPGN